MDVRALLYETRRSIGQTLARLRLHRIRYVETEAGPFVWKTRRCLSWAVVLCGNLYLRLESAEVEVLHRQRWLGWEQAVAARAPAWAANLATQGRGLICPRWPGRPLSHLLADPAESQDTKLACVGLAIEALEELHQHQADWGGGSRQLISHADATSENVIIETSSRTACWIDFDTRHLPGIPAIDRHADDLRALIFSAATHVPQPAYEQLVAQLVGSCQRCQLLLRFRERLVSDWRRFSTFQLAQAPLPIAACRRLRSILLRCLPS